MDQATADEIQERLDAGKDLNDPMVEALHSEPAETTDKDEERFQQWVASRSAK